MYPPPPKAEPTFSNLLILLSLIATILSLVAPNILSYGMNGISIMTGDWIGLGLQFVLYQFLHGGIFHLVANGLFLYIFGNQVELLIGRTKYIVFFAINTVFVGASLLLLSSGNTIGISGFAMAVLAYVFMELKSRNDPEWRGAGLFLFINIAIGLTGNISLVGHLAGAVCGVGFYLANKGLSRHY